VPSPASPAIVSPDTTDTVSGRKSGIASNMAANPVNSPFCVTRSTNGGPSPGASLSADKYTASPKRIGISAIAASIAQVLRRVNINTSSEARKSRLREAATDALAGNVKSFPGELYEILLETWPFHHQRADIDPCGYQIAVDCCLVHIWRN